MKKILLLFIVLLLRYPHCYAQNTFPSTGYVGIGTSSPVSQLQVAGITTTTVLSLSDGTNLAGYLGRGGNITSGFSATPEVLALTYMKRDFAIGGWGKTDLAWHGISFYINSDNGYVGIGTTNPQESLSVNGNIRSKQVKVETANWPDYVFDKEFKLPSLTEVQAYIDENHHLPDMPSAAAVAKEGLNLGEINKLLTRKVEELTLYLLSLKNDNEQLNSRLKVLENKIGVSLK